MKLLYLSSLYPPSIGGAQIQIHCLAKAMQDAGHAVRALTFTARNREDWLRLCTIASERERIYTQEGIPVQQVGFPWRDKLRMLPWVAVYYAMIPAATQRLSNIMLPHFSRLADRPDLVHVTRIGREFMAHAALQYCRDRKIPFVLTPNHHPRWRGWRYVSYDLLYREADAVIVYTEEEKKTLIHDIGVNPDRVHVTGVGPVLSESYSAEEFRRAQEIDGPFVLFLGQQYKYKGIGAVLKAAELTWLKYPGIHFVFIGPETKYSRELFAKIKDDRIHNLGSVDARTKTSALAACAFLCMPSCQESFGGVYLEAWQHGKAVIGGRIPPIACVVDNGVNGILTSQDPEDIARAIDHLLSNPAECDAMGEAGRRKLEAKYSWTRLAQETLKVYESLLAG